MILYYQQQITYRQVKFEHRNQKPNESFQEYEAKVVRLAQLNYPGVAEDNLNQSISLLRVFAA